MFRELTGQGVPKEDHKWVRLARSVPAEFIVTEDIDLFYPTKKKNCSAKLKAKIKATCVGNVAKHLKKSYGIHVICCAHVPNVVAG